MAKKHPKILSMFINKIKHLMIEHDVKQGAVAKAIKVSAGTMSNWMTGLSRPSMDDAFRLARYFKVSLDWLADDSQEYGRPTGTWRGLGGAVLDESRGGDTPPGRGRSGKKSSPKAKG
jgi:transcriptional regulator with XRE-family HTH domain